MAPPPWRTTTVHRAIALPLASLLVLASTAAASAQSAPNFCAPGATPTFKLGFATLKDRLGARMGDPVECEHPDPQSGDSLAHTSTGLAFYRQSTNTPSFTNGTDHWALLPSGLGHWTGSSIAPPTLTFDDIRYLIQVAPLAEQEGNLGPRLQSFGQNFRLNAPGLEELSAIRAELADISEQLNALTPGPNTQSMATSLGAVNTTLIDLLDTVVGIANASTTTQQATLGVHMLSLLPQLTTQIADMQADFTTLQSAADVFS